MDDSSGSSNYNIAPGYRWSQNQDTIVFTFEVPPTTRIVDVDVRVTETEVCAGIEAEPKRVVGKLHYAVLPSNTCPYDLKRCGTYSIVRVRLAKKVPIPWPFPIQDDLSDGTPMDAQSDVELAYHFLQLGDGKTAAKYLLRAADKGSMTAHLELGKLYLTGKIKASGGAEIAIEHCRKAAALGSGEAMYLLGMLHQENGQLQQALDMYGQCVSPQQIQRDAALDRESSQVADHARDAMFRMGKIYLDGGEGVARNVTAAANWWSNAAVLKHPQAVHGLACMYQNGVGVKQDERRALQLFREAHALDQSLPIPDGLHLSSSAALNNSSSLNGSYIGSSNNNSNGGGIGSAMNFTGGSSSNVFSTPEPSSTRPHMTSPFQVTPFSQRVSALSNNNNSNNSNYGNYGNNNSSGSSSVRVPPPPDHVGTEGSSSFFRVVLLALAVLAGAIFARQRF
eukprot:m.97571 g.97571  ORF g.97571 m.97571 type:complete len:452 (-) comp15535_c0_seq4:299-1654(-)